MASIDPSARVYQEIAQWYEQQRDEAMRDRFLLLAAFALLASGNTGEAEKVRARLLKRNPSHLLKPYASLAEAAKSRDIREYIDGLQRSYPPQGAEHLLESLRRGPSAPAKPITTPPDLVLPPLEPIRSRAPISPKPNSAKAGGSKATASAPLRSPGSGWPDGPRSSWRDGWLEADKPDAPAGAWVSVLLFWLLLSSTFGTVAYLFGGVVIVPH